WRSSRKCRRASLVWSTAGALAVIRYAKIYGTKHRPRLTGLQSRVAEARTADEFEHAFASLKAGNAEGVMLLADPTVIENGKKIAELALAAGLPTALQRRENVEAGGLFSYGGDNTGNVKVVAHAD